MPQRKNKRWSDREVAFLKENYKKMKVEELAEELDRTSRGVRGKAERLNLDLKSLERNKKHEWTIEDLEFLRNNYMHFTDEELAEKLDKTGPTICRKRLDMGLRKQTGEPYVHSEYYVQRRNGKRVWVHIEAAEKKLGRKLQESEMVHHVDGNKLGNSPDNLYVCKDRQEHQSIHNQLEKIAFQLTQKGVIGFDHQKGKYYIKSTRTEG